MKRLNILIVGIAMVLPFQFASAQKTGAVLQEHPSALTVIGKDQVSSFSLTQIVDLASIRVKQDGDEVAKQSRIGVNADFNIYPRSKWGYGTTIIFNQNTTEFTNSNTKTTTSEFGAFANISRIEVLSPTTAIYGRVGVGYLTDITKITSGSNSNKETNDGFALRGTVGMPLQLHNLLHGTPYVQYQYHKGKVDDGKFTDNTFNVGMTLEGYLRCSEDYSCDSKVGYKHSEQAYDAGKNMFSFWTNANFSTGTTKTTYDDPDENTTDKHSGVDLSVDYTRYLWKGIGLGAKIKINNNVQESKDFDFKISQTELQFRPQMVFQGPWDGAARNLFLNVDGIFGSNTIKTTSGSNSSTFKDKISGFGLGVGYNCFFSDNIAIAPIINYDWLTLKDDDSGNKQKQNELSLGIGLRAIF